MNITEEWRDCPVFPERYEISNFGNIRSKSFLKTGANRCGCFEFKTKAKPIVRRLNSDGYYQVRLSKDGQKISKTIHRLVALAFLPLETGKNYVNHKDSDRTNNFIYNLEWCTPQENIKHSYDYGKNSNSKENHPQSIYTEEIAIKIRELIGVGIKPREVSKMLNVNYWSVIKIKNNKEWVLT